MEKSFSERVVEAKAVVASVSVQDAHDLHGEAVTFVDPRPAQAIASSTGIIPGALNVTLGDIEQGRLPTQLLDRSSPIVTSCQAGPMGAIAAHELSKLGFSSVRYVDGGTQAWLDAGYPTQR